MTQTDAPAGVGQTAFAISFFRDLETQRPDALYQDPYAKYFLQAVGFYRNSTAISVRTKFFDDALVSAGAECAQVVLLAAGLDARAYRLPWPDGTRVFELDLPDVIGWKDRVLDAHGAKPAAERVSIPIDLRDDWPAALKEHGHDPARPTAWLAEGLLVYLTAEQCDALVAAVSALSAPGSRLIFGHQERRVIEHQKEQPHGELARELYRSGLTEHPDEWLDRHGWDATALRADEVARSYGRELIVEVAASWLVDARRRSAAPGAA